MIFVIGIIIVNIWTLWSAIIIFILGVSVQLGSHIHNKTLTSKIFIDEILGHSAGLTVLIIVVSIVITLYLVVLAV